MARGNSRAKVECWGYRVIHTWGLGKSIAMPGIRNLTFNNFKTNPYVGAPINRGRMHKSAVECTNKVENI